MPSRSTRLMIRLAYQGCKNRPFFHIVVQRNRWPLNKPPIEQIGSYDPMPNMYNEKLVGINFERLKYWYVIRGANMTKTVQQLLGLCGYLPIHYKTRLEAFRQRRKKEALAAKEQEEQKTAEQNT